MNLFGPRAFKEKNYKQKELELYTSLQTFRSILQRDELENGCYLVGQTDKSYRACFNLCFGLLKFYTKHKDEAKEYQFKRNFLLSKTRGIFMDQKKYETKIVACYLIEPSKLDRMINEYYNMFKVEKLFQELKEETK